MATFSEMEAKWKKAVEARRKQGEYSQELKNRLIDLQEELEKSTKEEQRLYKEEIQAKKDMIAVGNPKSFNQKLLQETESRLFDIPVVRANVTLKESEKRLHERQDEIDRIMKTLRSKVNAILQSYGMAMNDCEDLVYEDDRSDAVQDCRVEVGDAFAERLQRVIDATRPKLRKLGVTQFVSELDIPEEFDITE